MEDKTPLSLDQITKICLQKRFKTLHLPFVTHRKLHHWKATGLLNDERELASSGKKNEFDFFEMVWIRCIVLMRSFGINNLLITKVNASMSSADEDRNKASLSIFQKQIVKTLFDKQNCFLLVSEQGDGKFVSREEYANAIKDSIIGHHLSISLDILIKEMLLLLEFDSDIQKIIKDYLDTE
jgi:DNA-binding transcriptional MerR regulator